MINDNYLDGLAKLMTGESYDIPSHMAFGSTTGTLTANDVVTSGEFDRNAIDSANSTNNIAKIIGRRISSEAGSETIRLVSLTNSSTVSGSNDIQGNFLTSSIIHTTDFDFEVEFWFKHERA